MFFKILIISLFSILFISCNSDELIPATPKEINYNTSISSEKAEDRKVTTISHKTTLENTYFAEYISNYKYSYFKGLEIKIQDSKSGDLVNVLRLYRLDNLANQSVVFKPGVYSSNSLLVNPSEDIVVDLEIVNNGKRVLYKSIKAPLNILTFETINSQKTLLTFNLLMNSIEGSLTASGRLIINNY